ncbi:hypothetical protein RJ639_000686 [Escallonia herrerae]|uniref:Homeobox domain-containing protein n=1 Tax=Escallonia herrerae TaxID=1293975 RepID=A0AA89BLU2_9ASTE|nr:hypothetical protein RJ639_000686 [Escallonia herrerae]
MKKKGAGVGFAASSCATSSSTSARTSDDALNPNSVPSPTLSSPPAATLASAPALPLPDVTYSSTSAAGPHSSSFFGGSESANLVEGSVSGSVFSPHSSVGGFGGVSDSSFLRVNGGLGGKGSPEEVDEMAVESLSCGFNQSRQVRKVKMYGDCQVLSSMGGNGVSSDSLFSSPIPNSNFSFMANLPFNVFPPVIPKEESGLLRGKDEMESGSGSEHIEGLSGNEQEAEQQPPKKKRYHRHTARQIQEMEALFKECPHPDDKQRMKLSQDLDLKPRQVKFWFQNRRTQMKVHKSIQHHLTLPELH